MTPVARASREGRFAEASNRHDIPTPRRSLCYCVDRPVWLISNRHLLLTADELIAGTYQNLPDLALACRRATANEHEPAGSDIHQDHRDAPRRPVGVGWRGAVSAGFLASVCRSLSTRGSPRIRGCRGAEYRNFYRSYGELRRHSAVFGSGVKIERHATAPHGTGDLAWQARGRRRMRQKRTRWCTTCGDVPQFLPQFLRTEQRSRVSGCTWSLACAAAP
jgi:hypothetical protein